MFVFALTGRRVHIEDQRLDAMLGQRHGRGNPNGSGTDDDDVFFQVYVSLCRISGNRENQI
jgi:hypothetical protein